MQEYIIDVTQVEEWQTINDIAALEQIFQRAKSTIVTGEPVVLVRSNRQGARQRFDVLTTLEDLDRYRTSVFRYL